MTCQHCKTDFTPKSNKAKFCCVNCKQANYRVGVAALLKMARAVTGSHDAHDDHFWEPFGAVYKKYGDKPVKVRYVSPVPVPDTIPPMPKREHYEHSIDYGSAKSEWKLKYKQ